MQDHKTLSDFTTNLTDNSTSNYLINLRKLLIKVGNWRVIIESLKNKLENSWKWKKNLIIIIIIRGKWKIT